jgi:hypothetical protein
VRARLLFVPPGGGETDYALEFDLPGVPQRGDYISVTRPGQTGTEDFIVRRTWWLLDYPHKSEMRVSEPNKELPPAPMGAVKQLCVECEFALGPYPSDDHKRSCETYKRKKGSLQEFEESCY